MRRTTELITIPLARASNYCSAAGVKPKQPLISYMKVELIYQDFVAQAKHIKGNQDTYPALQESHHRLTHETGQVSGSLLAYLNIHSLHIDQWAGSSG